MRARMTRLLVALFAAGLATAVLAQGPGRGMGGLTPAALLTNKSVQAELKLTTDQTGKLQDLAKDLREKHKGDLDKARQDKDFAKMGEVFKAIGEETEKALPDVLKPEQLKRLHQIEIQVAPFQALAKPEVQKKLDLSDKQKTEITAITDKLQSDRQELFKDVGKDKDKRQEANKKFTEMNNEAKTKAIGVLNEDQKKTWKELTGAPFDYKPDFGPKKGKDN
jgi:hypothetical protein